MDYLNHLYGRNIKRIKEIDGGTIHKIKTHNQGVCYITTYQIFSGVSVMFNDIHASKLDMATEEHADRIQRYELNHCREGKFESILKDGTKISFEAGDFAINPFANCPEHSKFPIDYYHGISIYITPSALDEEAAVLQKYFRIHYGKILETLCNGNKVFLKRGIPEIDHIFYEMYRVPETIVIPYLKVKVQELFLYLTTLCEHLVFFRKAHFQKSTVEIINRLHQFIVKNSERYYTYQQLASLFNIKPTTMKNCYKSVYGITIYETIRDARLKKSIDMLKNTPCSITDIALEIGYSSHAKFSEVFKKVYHISPTEYKKIIASSGTTGLIEKD